jgi:hypothetical protein
MFDARRHSNATRALLGRLVGPEDRSQWVVLLQDDQSSPLEFFVVAHEGDSAFARGAVEDALLIAGYKHEPTAVPGAWTRAWRISLA